MPVLIVFSDAAKRLSIRRALEGMPLGDIHEADTQESFIDCVKARSYDVVMIDRYMPELTARDASVTLHRYAPDTSLIEVASDERQAKVCKPGEPEGNEVIFINSAGLPSLRCTVEQVLRRARAERSRRETEEALRCSEARYLDLYDNAPDMYFTIDREAVVVLVNRSGAEYLGYRKEELEGSSLWSVVYEDDRDSVRREIAQIFQTGTQFGELQCRKVRRDGSVLWAQGRTRLIEADSPTLRIMCRDITGEREAKKVLEARTLLLDTITQMSKQLLSSRPWESTAPGILSQLGEAMSVTRVSLFENRSDGRRVVQSCQRYEWVVPGLPTETGKRTLREVNWLDSGLGRWLARLSRGESVGGPIREMKAPERTILMSEKALSILLVPLFAGENFWGFFRFDDCRSERAWHEGEASVLNMGAGIVGAAIERQQAEDALRASEAKWRAITEDSPDHIALLDRAGNLMFVNNIVRGSEAELAIGTCAYDYLAPEYRSPMVECCEKAWNGAETCRCEVAHARRDGQIRYFDTIVRPVVEEGKVVSLAVSARNVTERKTMENALRNLAINIPSITTTHSLQKLVKLLADTLGLEYAFVGELDRSRRGWMRTLAAAKGKAIIENFSHEMRGTPCESVLAGTRCAYAEKVQDHYPDDSLLRELGIESYIGALLQFPDCSNLGLLVAMDTRPLANLPFAESVVNLFSIRAAIELERRREEENRLARDREHRNALVREVHHRFKNHLQGVAGLLEHQSRVYPSLADPLAVVVGQLNAISMVHGLLGKSDKGFICLGKLLRQVADAVGRLFSKDVEIIVQSDNGDALLTKEKEAVPIAMIINELLTNAIKYQLPEERFGCVGVCLERSARGVNLRFFSPGNSLPEGFDFDTGAGLGAGLKLLKLLLPRTGAELYFRDWHGGVLVDFFLACSLLEEDAL